VRARFRLAALERVRGTRLETALSVLATARRGVEGAVTAREAIAAQLAAALPPVSASPSEAIRASHHRDRLRAGLADAGRAVADAEREVDLAVAAWRAARAELRAVEALHERHRAARALAGARRDQLVLDDLAAQSALRRPSTGGVR
jgi:flagellar export protein FliJ